MKPNTCACREPLLMFFSQGRYLLRHRLQLPPSCSPIWHRPTTKRNIPSLDVCDTKWCGSRLLLFPSLLDPCFLLQHSRHLCCSFFILFRTCRVLHHCCRLCCCTFILLGSYRHMH